MGPYGFGCSLVLIVPHILEVPDGFLLVLISHYGTLCVFRSPYGSLLFFIGLYGTLRVVNL